MRTGEWLIIYAFAFIATVIFALAVPSEIVRYAFIGVLCFRFGWSAGKRNSRNVIIHSSTDDAQYLTHKDIVDIFKGL